MVLNKQKSQPVANALIIVRRRPGIKNNGVMQVGDLRLRCALGRGSISAFKREGDGATPLAIMPILRGFCKNRIPQFGRCQVALRVNRPQDGWCDAKGDANYNRPVRLPYAASAERMRRDDRLYDIGFVLDWNITDRRQGRGSAIFLHLARTGKGGILLPTQGCIALTRRNMIRLLPYLQRGSTIIVQR